jgi:hypothetical protein
MSSRPEGLITPFLNRPDRCLHLPSFVSQFDRPLTPAAGPYMSQSLILRQNPKIWCQEFNGLQIPTLSKKQLCDRRVLKSR